MDETIKKAIDELKGKPIEDFLGVMRDGLKLSIFFQSKMPEDGKIDDQELEMLCALFDVLSASAHYEDECRQKAYADAGGPDQRGSKNQAEKI